jgi:C1A family cysteine protease
MNKKALSLLVTAALSIPLFLTSCSQNTTSSNNPMSPSGFKTTAVVAGTRPLGLLRDASSLRTAKLAQTPLMGELPTSIDLSTSMPPIGDQGIQGSCVAWATGYAAKSIAQQLSSGWNQNLSQNEFSPSWLYNQVKLSPDCGSGTYPSLALDKLKNAGCDNISLFPYDQYSCSKLPDQTSLNRAAPFKIANWFTLNTDYTSIKSILASSKPVIIAIEVYPDYDNMNSTTNTSYDDFSGVSRGGHANCIVGYDDSKKAFKVANSWGTGWGVGGYYWLPYSAISDSRLGLNAYYFDNINFSKTDQVGWRYCTKCKSLFWGASQSLSTCPCGGTHTYSDGSTTSGTYTLFMNCTNTPSTIQTGWKFCGKCKSLFWGPSQSISKCPCGGQHDGSGSSVYGLLWQNDGSVSPLQDSWRYCHNCKCLFYGPTQSTSKCPCGGTHDGSISSNYFLKYN